MKNLKKHILYLLACLAFMAAADIGVSFVGDAWWMKGTTVFFICGALYGITTERIDRSYEN